MGITRQALSNKLNSSRRFTDRDFAALADFFHVSVDYLMGRTADQWPNKEVGHELAELH